MEKISENSVSVADLYARIIEAWTKEPELEGLMLKDFTGTIGERFGVVLPKPATLVRTANGFCLQYEEQTFALGDPRYAVGGELNDAELELVSGGGCPSASASSNPIKSVLVTPTSHSGPNQTVFNSTY